MEKIAANWEDPYHVHASTRRGAYFINSLEGEQILRKWNISRLSGIIINDLF